MIKVGFIDYFLHEWHANNYPQMLKNATNGEVQAVYCYGEVTSPYDNITNAQWARDHNMTLCETIEEVVEKSDVLCVLAPDNPEHHERLSHTPLSSGKITYVDKTFAPDFDSAKRMFDLAEKHSTPLMSSSALRFAAEYTALDRNGLISAVSIGGGTPENYVIHQIEPIVMLFGSDAKRLINTGTAETPLLTVEYNKNTRVSICCMKPECPFQMTFNYDDSRCRVTPVTSDFFNEFIFALAEFFKTGKPAVCREQTLAVIKMRDAAVKAISTPDKWISI